MGIHSIRHYWVFWEILCHLRSKTKQLDLHRSVESIFVRSKKFLIHTQGQVKFRFYKLWIIDLNLIITMTEIWGSSERKYTYENSKLSKFHVNALSIETILNFIRKMWISPDHSSCSADWNSDSFLHIPTFRIQSSLSFTEIGTNYFHEWWSW